MNKASGPIWRKVLWWVGIAVSCNLALYILIPKIASYFVEQQMEAAGLQHVNVVLDYPGVQYTSIPLISFQKDMGAEVATLTMQNLTLEYDLPQLFTGFLKAVRLEVLDLDISRNPAEQPQSITTTSPVKSSATPLAMLSNPMPELPFGLFSLTKATIFREQATGPLRKVTVSSLLRHDEGRLDGTVTFQGVQGDAYTLQMNISPQGKMKVVLGSGTEISDPLLNIESSMKVAQGSGIQWEGVLSANLKRATPFLGLLMPLGPDLERVNGMVNFQWDGSSQKIESLKGILQDSSTQLWGKVDAQVELPAWGQSSEGIFVNASGELHANAKEIYFDLSPTSQLKAFLRPRKFLKKEDLPFFVFGEREMIRLHANDRVRSRISLEKEIADWSMEGPLRIQFGEEHSSFGMDVVLTKASGQLLNPLSTTVQAEFTGWGAMPLLEHQQLVQVHDLEWKFIGQLDIDNQVVNLTLAEGSTVNTGLIQIEQGEVSQLAFRNTQSIPLTYDVPLQHWNIGLTAANIDLPTVRWQDQSVAISKIALQLKEAWGNDHDWSTKGTMKLLGVSATMENYQPPTTNLAIGFDANPEEFQAGIVAETQEETIRAKGRLVHHFPTQSGTLQATLTPNAFSPKTGTLSNLIQPWTHPFDITSGQLGVSIACGWKPTSPTEPSHISMTRGDLTLALKNIGGYYKNVLIDDVNSTITIIGNDLNNFAMLPPAIVSVGSVNAGVELTNTAFTMNFAHGEGDALPTVDLKNVSTNVFGGEISSSRIYVDLAKPPTIFTVRLEGIQLDQLLQLEQQKGLDGSGVLDGIIPVTINGSTVQVTDGNLAARKPGGIIQFQPLGSTAETLIDANSQMEIVLQSLQNFHYDVLKAKVNYGADGTLNLETRIEGRNPNIKGSRPVHFNLNVEEDIPALLKSLRVVKGIEEKIEKFLQGPMF